MYDSEFKRFCLGVLGLLIGTTIILSATLTNHLGVEKTIEKNLIYSIDTQKGLDGSFVLGYGGINTNVKYYIYQDIEDKGKLLIPYNSNTTYIKDILNPNEDSYVETEYEISYNEPTYLESFLNRPGNTVTYKGKSCSQTKRVISQTLYIPKGYIKKEINLNIK